MNKGKEAGSGGFEDIELGDPSFHRLSFIPNLIPIKTMYGVIKVSKEGVDLSPKKPVIITYHDIGLNGSSNFRSFFNYHDMQPILTKFTGHNTVIHINAPGQEDKAARFNDEHNYPTMDQMADQVGAICKHFEISNFIGLGTGAGANILSRFATRYPDFVDGLFLIDCTSTVASWSEWGYQNLNIHYLKNLDASGLGSLVPNSVTDYLLWHHFGVIDENRNQDLIFQLRSYFSEKNVHPYNLALFIGSYLARTDLGLVRGSVNQNFQCPVLLLTSFHSPHIEDTVYMNSRLNPEQSQWMKLSDCGMPLEEQPGKVAEAFRLFIQGLGYSLKAI